MCRRRRNTVKIRSPTNTPSMCISTGFRQFRSHAVGCVEKLCFPPWGLVTERRAAWHARCRHQRSEKAGVAMCHVCECVRKCFHRTRKNSQTPSNPAVGVLRSVCHNEADVKQNFRVTKLSHRDAPAQIFFLPHVALPPERRCSILRRTHEQRP